MNPPDMKRLIFIHSLMICSIVAGAQSPSVERNKLWYEKPADKWLSALPLGNGTLGGMVYGTPAQERIRLNENSLVTGTPDYVGYYQVLGDLYIETGHQSVTTYRRELDLSKATHRVSYVHDGVTHVRESFVSYPDEVMVVMLTSNKRGETSVKVSLQDDRKTEVTVTGNRISFRGSLKENGMEYACGMQIKTKGEAFRPSMGRLISGKQTRSSSYSIPSRLSSGFPDGMPSVRCRWDDWRGRFNARRGCLTRSSCSGINRISEDCSIAWI